MPEFVKFVLAPAGLRGASLAIAGSRAGGVGVLNAELADDVACVLRELDALADPRARPLRPEDRALSTASGHAMRSARSSRAAWAG